MEVASNSIKPVLSNDHPFNLPIEDRLDHTLLQISCEPKYPVKFLEGLLSVGVSAALYNDLNGDFPVHAAARKNNSKAIDLLLKNGANVNSRTYYSGRSALHICAKENFLEAAIVLLDHEDVDVDMKDYKGEQTPLYIAVTKKNVKMVKVLIEHGADLNYKVFWGKTILERIKDKIPQFDALSVNVLVPRKVPTEREVKFRELDALIEKASLEENRYKGKMYLKEFEAILLTLDKNKGDFYGYTNGSLLHRACLESQTDFAQAILDGGFADPNEMSAMNKMTALFIAANRANLNLIKMLLKYGANIELAIRKDTKDTILHALLSKDNNSFVPIENVTECLMYFLDPPNTMLGRNISISIKKIIDLQNTLGYTALHSASHTWSEEVQALILSYQPNLEIENLWNETPYNYSIPTIPSNEFQLVFDKICNERIWIGKNEFHETNVDIECCRLNEIEHFLKNDTTAGMSAI